MSTLLAVDQVRTDGGTQSRAELNQEVVRDYAERLREGDTFPPVVVYFDGKDYWLSEGFHRHAAHVLEERDDIEAEVREGTRRDALLNSIGSNADHGLRRTNADKRFAVQKLLDDPEWSQWSNREIARRCAVSYQLVNNVRSEVAPLTPVVSDARTYTTKHGTVAQMDVSGIRESARERAEREGRSRAEELRRLRESELPRGYTAAFAVAEDAPPAPKPPVVLAEKYAALVDAGQMDRAEAERLTERDEREHQSAVRRAVEAIESFLNCLPVVRSLAASAFRDDILAALCDHDRERILKIEKETKWPATI